MKAAFTPEETPVGSLPFFDDLTGDAWMPLYHHACVFGPGIFTSKMENLIKNPNINSSWLFRADIIYDDCPDNEVGDENSLSTAHAARDFTGFERQRTLVRRLVPRNERRDAPLEQTCSFHQTAQTETSLSTLVIYIPHSTTADMPFYHPKVRGIAHLHVWDPATSTGRVSVHFLPCPENPIREDQKLQRTAFHLLQVVHKHGTADTTGYVKRVNHDVVIPQQRFQDRYARLKNTYGRRLIDSWMEVTDPNKHVFEDLGIAAFLIELWTDMYKDTTFPGFVDIGCGNGLLVYILNEEGFLGWGFDARERKSWAQYKTDVAVSPSGSSLEQRLLLPSVVSRDSTDAEPDEIPAGAIHDGIFPRGTFIVSNHADELTPWTPILATISQCPFIMIPCCSHSLGGARNRAPPPRDRSKSQSTFASLVDWAERIAADCGWAVETEMLRIPSSRNTCLLGRARTVDAADVDVDAVLGKHGGAEGYYATVAKLVKSAPKGH